MYQWLIWIGLLMSTSISVCWSGEEVISMNVDANGATTTTTTTTTNHNKIIEEEEEEVTNGISPIAVVIKNPRSAWVDYYWENPETLEAVYQGKIDPKGTTATSSYVGHTFIFTPLKKGTKKEFARVHIVPGKNLYILPLEKNNKNKEDLDYYQHLLDEQKFVEEYKQRTGRPWLAYYPRAPPVLHMWKADYVGQTHQIVSNEYYWTCIPEDLSDVAAIKKCREEKPITITLEVLETDPKVFRINNALSEVEADFIVSLAKPKIRRSLAGTHGGLVSSTRTSKNTWIDRHDHLVMDTLYRRAANILNLSEAILYPDKNVEQLQVVNYQVGEEYTSHHDFGADGNPQQRMITLLYYLNEQETPDAGGETMFPKAKQGPLKVHAGRGNAVLFYSMLEDGNSDDLSLHAALPVKQGEKWVANFWVWDPHR